MMEFLFWAFENEKTNTGRVRYFSEPLPGPRGHKLKDHFLKIVDIEKVSLEGNLNSLVVTTFEPLVPQSLA